MRRAATLLALAFSGCADDAPSGADTEPASSDGGTSGMGDDVADGMTDGGPSETATDGMTEGGMTEGDTTSGPTDTGPTGCMGDEECTERGAPFCVAGSCEPCSAAVDPDAACASLGAGTPLCIASQCVQCTAENDDACMGTTPLCDADTNTCTGCTSHDQCEGEAACELVTGACFPSDAVFYVDGDASCPGVGTQAMPYCAIQPAIDAVGAGGSGTIWIAELAGGVEYNQALTIAQDKHVALLALPGDRPILRAPADNTLSVTGANTVVYVDGLRFSANTSAPAIEVDAATLYIQRTEVVQNSQGGVVAQNGSDLTLENCFVGANGQDFADTPGLSVNGSAISVVYTTIAANRGNAPQSIACSGAVSGSVRNSIVVGLNTASIACGDADFTNNLVDTAGLGASNVVQNLNPAWFPSIASADYHVATVGPYDDLAVWQTGDPLIDIDGDARPATDGAADYAGADAVP